jgi:hypothetical protein
MQNASTSYFDATSLQDEIRSWVEIESPTTDPSAVNRMVDKVGPMAGLPGAARATVHPLNSCQ